MLACLCFLAGAQLLSISATYDEPSYIAAGYTYLVGRDFRMFALPLAPKVSAAPLIVLPFFNSQCRPDRLFRQRSQAARYTLNSWVDLLGDPLSAPQYALAHLFFFAPTDAALARLKTSSLAAMPTAYPLQKSDYQNDADLMLHASRAAMLIFPLGLGLIIFFWSLELFGIGGALLSLSFFCFNPNIIANGSLATIDLPIACLYCSTVYFFWRATRNFSVGNLAAMCVSFGLAQTVKYSAVLLGVTMLVLLVLLTCRSSWRPPRLEKLSEVGNRLVVSLSMFIALAVAAVVCIWWQFDFRYDVSPDRQTAVRQMLAVHPEFAEASAARLGHLPLEKELRTAEAVRSLKKMHFPGGSQDETKGLDAVALFDSKQVAQAMPDRPHELLSKVLLLVNEHRLLPETYTFGLALIGDQMICRQSYLLGHLSLEGSPFYYFWAGLLKNPLILLASLLACLMMMRQWKTFGRFNIACVLAPALIYTVVACLSRFNIGIRHLLPVFPFLFVLLGMLSKIGLPSRLQAHKKLLLACVIGINAVSSTFVFAPLSKVQSVFPDYLTYFNELAGGPSNGWKYLLDSNLDWGQGLKPLALWLKQQRINQPIYLCYFGQADPLYEGITFYPVVGGQVPTPSAVDFSAIKAPAHFAISANLLLGLGASPRFEKAVTAFIKQRCIFEALVDNCIFVYRVIK
jgi:hypothetical protein